MRTRSILIFLILFTSLWNLYSQEIDIAFRLAEKDLIPEGIAYDPISKCFFVSSIHKNKIVRIDNDQQVKDFIKSGQEGIGQVLGMKAHLGKLWVCSNTGEGNPKGKSMIHAFDITSGALSKKCILQSSGETHLFNDLVISKNGDVFISDSDFGAIYIVNNRLKSPELLIKDDRLNYANGITLTPNDEVIVNTFKGFFKINTITREIKALPFRNYFVIGIDGLSFYKQSLIGIQNITYPVCINQYNLNASFDSIENANVLVSNHPLFDIPTTGVVVDDWFYFIANSQMSKLDKDKIINPEKLNEILIMKVRLN
jgi:hypothetical protein